MTDLATDAPITIELTASRGVVAASGGLVHARLVVSPAPLATAERRPVAIAIVVDRSGSMGDVAVPADAGCGGAAATQPPTKLAFVKSAAERLVETMLDGDAVAVVSFDDAVRLEAPMTVLTAANRRHVVGAIRRIACGGCTNMWDGLEHGLAQFPDALRRTHSCKVVVLSDGLANAGPRTDAPAFVDRCATAASGEVTVSTLGVGTRYDSALLGRMADAGNGDFHHIEAPDVLDEVFAEELAAAGAVQARGVTLEVTLPAAVAASDNLNGYPQEVAEHGLLVRLGDVARSKDLVLELSTPVELSDEKVRIGVEVRFTDGDGATRRLVAQTVLGVVDPADVAGAPEDIEVARRVLELVNARARMIAMQMYDAGDVGAARAALAGGRAHMAAVASMYTLSPDAAASAGAALAEMDDIQRMLDEGSITPAEAKRMHGRSRDVNRSQTFKEQ